MKISRYFTAKTQTRDEGLEYETRSSRITNPDGSVVFEAKDIALPTGWSQVAVDIIAQKYFRRAGVPVALEPVPERAEERRAVVRVVSAEIEALEARRPRRAP